jgi:hypothetical protein
LGARPTETCECEAAWRCPSTGPATSKLPAPFRHWLIYRAIMSTCCHVLIAHLHPHLSPHRLGVSGRRAVTLRPPQKVPLATAYFFSSCYCRFGLCAHSQILRCHLCHVPCLHLAASSTSRCIAALVERNILACALGCLLACWRRPFLRPRSLFFLLSLSSKPNTPTHHKATPHARTTPT